ncbi:MAG: TetR/AcrR family transcriptional regulator [Mycobacterium sp.]
MTQAASRARRRRSAKIGRPPGSSGEETVARLLDAAQIQFGDRGYAGARMTEIAQAAGINHSSIYQYFGSKKDLYRAAFDAAQAELLPEYLAAIASADTLRKQIAAIFRASVRAHERHPAITPFLASIPIELRRHPDLLSSLQAEGSRLYDALHQMFDRARERGEIPPTSQDNDMLIAFIGSAMGVGLLSHGMPSGHMRAAVDVLLAAFDGEFFTD